MSAALARPGSLPELDAGPADDPAASARAARLRYVRDAQPGIRRRRQGDQFSYLGPDGEPIEDEEVVRRIKSLAIPPAWTDVWICPNPQGHIQATGRDARGRKQYRYHPRWRSVRDAAKYDRMLVFAQALPRIRERTEHDLKRPGMPREKVLAAVVQLLEDSRIRVGNEEYVKENGSYGLTTFERRHVDVDGSEIRFRFKGKSGKRHAVTVKDAKLARLVKRCLEIPGQELFQYLDEEGEPHDVESEDVNEYLREIAGDEFTAKDFRTWAGTVLAARFFRQCEPCTEKTGLKKEVVRTIARVAEELGNTPAVCKKCYVHPAVIAAYLAGTLKPVSRVRDGDPASDLSDEEKELLALLSSSADLRNGRRARRNRSKAA